MSRIYGRDVTHLTLTKTALNTYADTDPLMITEHDGLEDDEYLYDISGAIEAYDVSGNMVNDLLEALTKEG